MIARFWNWLFTKPCKHNYGPIQDGYQRCITCGQAVVVPCNHKWVNKERINKEVNVEGGTSRKSIVFLYMCEKCGITRKEEVI